MREIDIRLGRPLYSVDGDQVIRLGNGRRLNGAKERPGKTLVINDSSASGVTIKAASKALGTPSAPPRAIG